MDRDERLRGSSQHIAASVLSRVSTITYLHENFVKDSIFKVYSAATVDFAQWLGKQHFNLSTFPELDEIVTLYIAHLYDDYPRRGTRQKAINTYAGFEYFFPSVQKVFRTAWLAVRGWDRLVPARSPLPISQFILEAVCGQLLHHDNAAFSLAICLCFSGYLRSMELLQLRFRNILFPQDPRLTSSGSGTAVGGLLISISKTGSNQFVPIADRTLIRGLHLYCSRSRLILNAHLFPFSYKKLQSTFRASLTSHGLQADQFFLHSIPHGGATTSLLNGTTFADIQQKGRWASAKSCKRYLNADAGLLALNALSDLSKRRIARYQRYFALASVGWIESSD